MSGTTSLAAAVGVDARTSAARSQSGVSCSCPTADTTGTGQSATARTTRSSENGSRSSKLPPPRASTITSAPRRQRSPIAVAIATVRAGPARTSRRRRCCAGGKRCTICVSTSRFAAASLPVTSPIRRGIARQRALRSAAKRPSAASFRFSRSSAARCAPRPKRSIVSAFSRSRRAARTARRGRRRGRARPRRARGRARRTARAASVPRASRRPPGP